MTIAKSERLNYLLKCYDTAYEQMLFGMKNRDSWLKIQLLAQAIFLALASGVEMSGVKATSPVPTTLALAIPTSLVLAALYVLEDRTISHEMHYIARLSVREAELSSSLEIINNMEASPENWRYARQTLPIRAIAQVGAFLLIPADLAFYRFSSQPVTLNTVYIVEIIIDVLSWLAIAGLIAISYRQRQEVAKDIAPPNAA
jgi:hypothetical protein